MQHTAYFELNLSGVQALEGPGADFFLYIPFEQLLFGFGNETGPDGPGGGPGGYAPAAEFCFKAQGRIGGAGKPRSKPAFGKTAVINYAQVVEARHNFFNTGRIMAPFFEFAAQTQGTLFRPGNEPQGRPLGAVTGRGKTHFSGAFVVNFAVFDQGGLPQIRDTEGK